MVLMQSVSIVRLIEQLVVIGRVPAICLANNAMFHANTKHIDVRTTSLGRFFSMVRSC